MGNRQLYVCILFFKSWFRSAWCCVFQFYSLGVEGWGWVPPVKELFCTSLLAFPHTPFLPNKRTVVFSFYCKESRCLPSRHCYCCTGTPLSQEYFASGENGWVACLCVVSLLQNPWCSYSMTYLLYAHIILELEKNLWSVYIALLLTQIQPI